MPLQLGLVGLPNVGKSTLFNALTQAGAMVASYPFTTIEPNIGVVPVPDQRLTRLGEIIKPERLVAATLRVVDIAGLVKGASQGEGLGNQFLSHIRGVDAVAMVVRCFQAADIPHVTAELDPVDDMETIMLELILSDVELLQRRMERVQTQSKGQPQAHADELALLERAAVWLGSGRPLRRMIAEEGLNTAEQSYLAEVDLLTTKPMLYVANVGEDDLPDGGTLAQQVKQRAEDEGAQAIMVCAGLEADITEWAEAEKREYLAESGIDATGLEQFIHTGYGLLDYITFFTTTGGKEVRAWNLTRGGTALDAAAQIHTDMAQGFIRAEVVPFEALDAGGSVAAAREAGKLMIEGKEYVVRDGDVLHIRFNV